MVGFDGRRFTGLSATADDLKCAVCLNVFDRAVDTHCGHTFCYSCLEELVTNHFHDICIQCLEPLATRKQFRHSIAITADVSVVENHSVNAMIARMAIKCDNHRNGCREVLPLASLEDHLKTCEYTVCHTCGVFVGVATDDHNCVDGLIKETIKWRKCYKSVVKENRLLRQKAEELETKAKKSMDDLKEKENHISDQMKENQRLTQRLDECLVRETNGRKVLETLLKVCADMKEGLKKWKNIPHKSIDTHDKQTDDSNGKLFDDLLSLIWSLTQTERTVEAFVESREEFRQFMATILRALEAFVANEWPLNAETIETVCGICANIFSHRVIRDDEIVIKGWDQWVDCLSSVDNRYSITALFNITFNRKGLEAMHRKNGFVTHLVRNLMRADLKFAFNLKSIFVKLIHILIAKSNDNNITQKLCEELLEAMPIDTIQDMARNESNHGFRKDCSHLLSTIGRLSAEH